MKSRLLVLFALPLLLASCASLGHFNPAYESFDRGLALFNQGHFAEAASYFERATCENPEFGEAYFYLGRAYLSQSRWRSAIPPLRTAFRLSPRAAQQENSNEPSSSSSAVNTRSHTTRRPARRSGGCAA